MAGRLLSVNCSLYAAAVRHTNYDAIADSYDTRYSQEDYGGIERALLEFAGTAGQQFLEVGCGTGHWLQWLDSRNIVATGLDRSRAMLSRAQMRPTRACLIQGRAEDLPLKSISFDCIFCINAHHHFADKPRFFAEARRVLRPGGSLMTVALDPHTGSDTWWVYDYFQGTLAIDKERYPSCHQIQEWMNNAGFIDTYSQVVQHEAGEIAASTALETGMITPAYTSQLAVLTDGEFADGENLIRLAMARDNRVTLSADLRVYATYGRVPSS